MAITAHSRLKRALAHAKRDGELRWEPQGRTLADLATEPGGAGRAPIPGEEKVQYPSRIFPPDISPGGLGLVWPPVAPGKPLAEYMGEVLEARASERVVGGVVTVWRVWPFEESGDD